MNKHILSITSLMAAGIMLAACQSGTYHVTGKAETMKDGDTLFLTNDFFMGTPIDTLIVKDGKFEFSGTADSTYLCLIYSPKDDEMSIPFFIEPGTIKLTLSANPQKRRVSGSASTNNKWQELNDSIAKYGQQINAIAAYIQSNDLSQEELKAQMQKRDDVLMQFKRLVLDYAKKNLDNEFGFFLLTYYDSATDIYKEDGMLDVDSKLELISKMPRHLQERQAMKAVVNRLNRIKAQTEGGTITDFTMNDINGKPLRLMEEIRKNRITVIDFWASWCGPCLREMPSMVRIYRQYKDKGLGIVGISLDSHQADWENATKRFNIDWPQVSDLQGWNNAAAKMYNVTSIPYTIVADSTGTILKKGLRGTGLEVFIKSELE